MAKEWNERATLEVMASTKQLARAVRREHRRRRNRSSQPPNDEAMREMLARAGQAAEEAEALRRYWRRRVRPDSSERRDAISSALATLLEVERPIKAERNRAARERAWDRRYGKRLREVSAKVQSERRKLWKMQHPVRRSNGS